MKFGGLISNRPTRPSAFLTAFLRVLRGRGLFVVRPHPQDLNDLFTIEYLVYQPMLDVDPSGEGAAKLANEALKSRWGLKGVLAQKLQ